MIPITEPPSLIKKHLSRFNSLFSKPQSGHFATYLTGLIVSSNKTVQGINNNFIDHKDQSNLNLFLNESNWDEQELDNRRLELIKESAFGGKETKPKDSFLVIDDTISHKTGKEIEQVELVFDHSIQKNVLGHQLVTSLLVSKDKQFPIGFRLYQREKDDSPDFKSKVQLARELIEDAVAKGISFSCVVFDSWYLSAEIVSCIKKLGKYWVSPLKNNRIVIKQQKRIPVLEYLSTIPKSVYKQKYINGVLYWYYAETINISKLGKIFIVAYHKTPDCSDEITILGSSALVWTPDKIIYTYLQRWNIETFYKDSKQNLGFEDYELRKLKGIIRHWHLVFLAYTILQLSSHEQSLTKWVSSNLKTIGDQCRFAVSEIIKYFVLWILKMYQYYNDEEKVVTLIFNPKAQFRFSFE
jgi:SRSO17 transposase